MCARVCPGMSSTSTPRPSCSTATLSPPPTGCVSVVIGSPRVRTPEPCELAESPRCRSPRLRIRSAAETGSPSNNWAWAFEVLDIPGHTRAHIAYYGSNMVFCGDTLFACGCGRVFEGTPQQLYASLEKLAALPDDTLVYCGHEYTLANIRLRQGRRAKQFRAARARPVTRVYGATTSRRFPRR